MLISFFEEFPTDENLAKLKLVSWKTKLYLAARGLNEFRDIKAQIWQENILELVYWPILRKKEGYWVSPFSQRSALERIFIELKKKRVPVMLDLELPTTRNPWLFLTQLPFFFKNKKMISDFISQYEYVSLAEYLPEGKWEEKLLELLGLHFPSKHGKVIKMLYTSMHDFSEDFIRKELKEGVFEFGARYLVGLGTIAPGVKGDEPLLKPKQLRRDLALAEEAGVDEVVLFRLGGLNKGYAKICREFY